MAEKNDNKYVWQPTAITIVVLMFMSLAISYYGEVEGQWFNSYVRNVSNQSYFRMSLMVSTSAWVGTFAFILWGAFSDNMRSKWGRRVPILSGGLIISGVFVYLFGITTSYWWLLVCDGVILGITSNMFHVTNRVMVPDLWEKENRGKINTYLFIGATLGTAAIWISSLLILPEGSQTYSRETHQQMFLTATILMIVAAILIWVFIKEPRDLPPREPVGQSLKKLLNRKEMMKHKDFLKLFIASLFVIMASNCYKPYFLILLQDFSFTRDQIIIAAILLVVCVGGIVYLLMNRLDKAGRKHTTYICLIISPIGAFVIAFSNEQFYLLLIGIIILFPFSIALQICIDTWAQDLLPENQRGKFLGIINIGKAGGQIPAILAAGALADAYNILYVFLLTGILLVVAIPFFKPVPETIGLQCEEDDHLPITATPEESYTQKVVEFVEQEACNVDEKGHNVDKKG